MIVCIMTLAACTIAIDGQAGRVGTSLGLPPVPEIPEEPAQWAMSALDPCALTRDLPLDTAQGFFTIRPHSCAADYAPAGATGWLVGTRDDLIYTRVGGEIVQAPRLVVRVGAAFDISDRSKMIKMDFGGRIAYQAYGEHLPAPEINSLDWRCRIDIPISADRSIQIVSSAVEGGDLNAACAVPRTVAETVAAKLMSPATSARTSPTGLGRWTACDLLEHATGYVAGDRDSSPDRTVDTCAADAPGAGDSAPTLEIDTNAGRFFGPSKIISETAVDLPFGRPAVQKTSNAGHCQLTFVAELQPDAPENYDQVVMKLQVSGSRGDPCAEAVDAATKIHNTYSAPAPQPPPAPEHLGFAVGEPDAEMPAACGVFTGPTPESCRIPLPIPVPTTAQEVLRAAGRTTLAQDVSCAILRDAAAPVVGDAIELAASINVTGGGCIGLTNDAYAVYLGFFEAAAAGEYCLGSEKQEVQIAGRPAIQCSPNSGTFHLYLPVTTNPAELGVVLVEARLVAPRGDMSWVPGDSDPAAEARMADGTTRIAENVINQRLSG
jgi:hypothetical protein